MNKTVGKERYAGLERELGERREQVPYQALKTAVIETYVMGRMIGIDRHLIMAETLGLGKKAGEELEKLYSTILMPLQKALDTTKGVLNDSKEGINRLNATKPANAEDEKREINEAKARAGSDLSDKILPDLFYQLGLCPNIKRVIGYPLLIGTLNTWRRHDFEFADKIIKTIKAQEPDYKLRILIEQLDIPVTKDQIRRN